MDLLCKIITTAVVLFVLIVYIGPFFLAFFFYCTDKSLTPIDALELGFRKLIDPIARYIMIPLISLAAIFSAGWLIKLTWSLWF